MKLTLLLMLMQFQQIPGEYLIRDSLFKYINPPDTIIWWEAEKVDTQYKIAENLFCSDPKRKIEKLPYSTKNMYPYYYIPHFNIPFGLRLIYRTDSLNNKYITEKQDFKNFIGTVDNLPEAIISAYLYDLIPGLTKSTGSFCKKDDAYFLNLTKGNNPPDVYFIEIDENGNGIIPEPIVYKIKVCKNGDVFLYDKKKKYYRKLELSDSYQGNLREK
jgi:hypothetical protein